MAASVNLAILIGLVTVAGLIALSISALMNASWRRPREMSPSLSCVALAHEAQGLLAVEVVPALLDDDRAAVAVPLLASSAYTRTPPTASVMFLKPSKLVFATWWMRILSRFSMVCTSSGSRPKA